MAHQFVPSLIDSANSCAVGLRGVRGYLKGGTEKHWLGLARDRVHWEPTPEEIKVFEADKTAVAVPLPDVQDR